MDTATALARTAWIDAIDIAQRKIAAALGELEAKTGVTDVSIASHRIDVTSLDQAPAHLWAVDIELNAIAPKA